MYISLHSYKGGTGKTNIAGNMAAYLANSGSKVCVIDMDSSGPGMHSLFNVKPDKTLIDYLTKKCNEEDILYRIGEKDLYLIPVDATEEDMTTFFTSPVKTKECILKLLKCLGDTFNFDHIIMDCGAGISKSSLLVMNIADFSIVVSTLDKQDINGTYVITGVANKLNCKPHVLFNRIPENKYGGINEIINDFAEKLGFETLEAIMYDKKIANAWSRKIIVDSDPDTTYSTQIKRLVDGIISGSS